MPDPILLPVPESFQKIQRFVVLMLENRSFDHLVGYMKISDPRVAGLMDSEYSNPQDPNSPQSPKVAVTAADSFVMSFDPGHEFDDVQIQLYGPQKNPLRVPNLPVDPAPMTGFVYSAAVAAQNAKVPADVVRVMECFLPDQVPVMSTLIRQFALFNFWHSSLPGPTWPNRFFVHAATSGGLTDSPNTEQIIEGFSFKNGTIYEKLKDAGKDWRIYHDGLPQTAGIDSLRLAYVDPFTKHFRDMKFFEEDVKSSSLPEYTFIEPNYDTGHNYLGGNSMHPLNDIRKGERLVKRVYEALRNSAYWNEIMLIITFDEHGGFYDHISPPSSLPTGDDDHYSNPSHSFTFDHLGVRVPTILVSTYTQKGTVIGADPKDATTIFDHSSILATVEKRFGLTPLTHRDAAARTLDIALNLKESRSLPDDAPTNLPGPVSDSLLRRFVKMFRKKPMAAAGEAPLSENQKSLLSLALACDLNVSELSQHQALRNRHAMILRQKDAADYIREVENKIHSRRR